MSFAKNKPAVVLLLIVCSLVFIAGCGGETDNTVPSKCNEAPFGSIITINPSEQPITVRVLAVDTHLNWQVSVKYPDGINPMPTACLIINGAFAVPNGYGLYTFETYQSHQPLTSGFKAATNNYGSYTFSTLLSAGSTSFFDTISATSGGNVPGTAKIEIKDAT
jgi:hypothetical protein